MGSDGRASPPGPDQDRGRGRLQLRALLEACFGMLNADTYAALLIVIALTTALPPFALKWLYMKWGGDASAVTGLGG